MKKTFLVALALFGAGMVFSQSTTTGDNIPTNGTKTGHKLENTSRTVLIPAKDADGSEKHDSIIARDTIPDSATKAKKESKRRVAAEPKTEEFK